MDGKISLLEKKILGENLFDMAISANLTFGTPNKNHPDTLVYAMQTLEVPPEKTIYIGNSAEDMHFAQSAGVDHLIVQREVLFSGLEHANMISGLYALRNEIR